MVVRLASRLRSPKLLLPVLATIAIAAAYGTSVAQGEEKPPKVLTVEKTAGPEVVVGDAVAAGLQASTKVEFLTSSGEITCGKSEIKGTVKTNPEKGTGNAVIKLETFTFGGCTTNIAGLTVKSVTIEELPLFAETEGPNAFKIGNAVGETGVEFALENAAKEELICVYRTTPLKAPYRNNNEGEVEIDERLAGFFNKKKCGACPPGIPTPTWKAKYRPLKDETGARAGKQIFIN